MPIPDGPFIFVSYSNKDAGFVHLEIKRLERQGYRVWFDKGEIQPSRIWTEEIRKAIAACACFMVFITEDSVVSNHVCDEIDQALTANKPFIGVYWDNVELPAGLQKLVRSRQTLDRYSMHKSAYEAPLQRALSEYITFTVPQPEPATVPVPLPSRPPTEVLPKILFFSLLVLVAFFLCFTVVVIIASNFLPTKRPDDLISNPLLGVMGAITSAVIAFGLGVIAFVVFRVYLRKTK